MAPAKAARPRRSKGSGGVVPYSRGGKAVGWRAHLKRAVPGRKKPLSKSKTFLTKRNQTKADAERWLRDELAKLDAGTPDAGGTLGGWLEEWMRSHKAEAAASNWQRDMKTIRMHVEPRLGAVKLADLSATRLNAWLADLHEAGVSASERKRAAGTLKKVLRAHEHVPRAIWDRVKRPKHKPAESRHLAPAELADLVAVADSWEGWYGAMVRVAVDCGLRAGELLGLQWGDYDPAAGTLAVRRAVCPVTRALKETKTDGSRRVLPLGPKSRRALDALPPGERGSALFAPPTRCETGHYGYMNWRKAVWVPLVRAAGLGGKGVVPKSLRHTCASQLLARGANIVLVSKRLGHSTVTQTLNIYAHLMTDDQAQAALMLDEILGP